MDATSVIRDTVNAAGTVQLTVRKLSGDLLGEDIVIVVPCFCVQDSPENPCRCPVWPWIMVPQASILREDGIERRTADGDGLSLIELEAGLPLIQLEASRVRADQILPGGADPFRGRAALFGRSRLDAWLQYMAAFWYYVTVGAWGPLPENPPEPPG